VNGEPIPKGEPFDLQDGAVLGLGPGCGSNSGSCPAQSTAHLPRRRNERQKWQPLIAIFHASHDELPKISKTFGRESAHVKSTIDRLNRVIQVLEGGDWIGEGAATFYGEMHSEVMPALLRLMKALEMGAAVTEQINRLVEEVEQETVHFFSAILVAFEGGAASEGGGLGGQGRCCCERRRCRKRPDV